MIDQPRVWVIRADYGASTDAFAENGYIGVGHGMDGVDLSRVTSQDEIKRLFVQKHPDEQSAQSIGNRSSQVARFHLEIRSEDYVLTPELDREWVRYGRFDSDKRYYVDKDDGLPHRNRRSVNWSPERLRRDDLPDGLLQGGMTLYEVADESRRDGFFQQIQILRQPEVWIVRGGANAHAVSAFLERGYAGIGFDLQDDDLSLLNSADEIRDLYFERNPGGSSIGSNQVIKFCWEMKPGDYVVMPGPGSRINHYGRFTSDLFNDGLGPYKNKRTVNWSDRTISREELDLSGYRPTVTHLKGEVRERFLETIANGDGGSATEFRMPEDSWVPFHLEVGRKLIEGEWWREEKRDEFTRMVRDIRWADPGEPSEDDTYEEWSADPYSFYLSFNMRTSGSMRIAAYRKVQELLQVEAGIPDERHEAYGLGVGWGWDPPLDDDGVEFLWDFFRLAIEFDPRSNQSDGGSQFMEFYDRAASESFLAGMRSRVLTYLLYWIDPSKYVLARRLRQQELGLAGDMGVSAEHASGAEYLETLRLLREIGAEHDFTMLDVNRKSTTRESLGLDPIVGPIDETYDVDAMLADGVFLKASEIERMRRILSTKKNLILQGPPGVGKTFIARKLAYVLMGAKTEERIRSVQFHQSYSYEDFVGGFRPDVEDGQMVFTRQDGPFLRMCAAARANPDDDYVMLIDEINRGNLSRVFGELLMLIEADKRKAEFGVSLQHRRDDYEKFFVPPNVYIIGTMNLADRSLTGMNVAMRRRFGFVDLKPQFNERVFTDWLSNETAMPPGMRGRINTRMAALNSTIATDPSLGINYAVGHSFFCPPDGEPEGGWEEWYETVVEYEVRPLLREYWFDAPETANDHADELLAGD